ncbi:hypothetical protein [Ensifer sp. OV372]|uniref:hypothetical protein n=1 Tax=Ensifer sp. OV372 TaxID=1855293 RepID=UPI0008E9E0C5|nr:hypothetical protein [Ensifer sp. OV372]SFH52742.1 hypothetical protein SAMN05216459_14330 [Ensifer sp. OV372]
MRMFHYAHAFARSLYRVFDICAAVATVVASLTLAVIRYGAGHTWHSLRSLGITAYRKIADLRPEYRESYDSHGLSLEPDRMRT